MFPLQGDSLSGGFAPKPPRRWVAPLGLLLLPLLVYGRFILGDELANADVFLAYRPAHGWLAEGLRAGRVPLWNAFLLGGFPLAFSEYGWFSPLTWLPLVAFGPHAGYYVAVALYVGLSGGVTFALARLWGASVSAAVLAGVVYGQSSLVAGGAPLLNQGAAYWALPALLWCVWTQLRLPRSHLAAPMFGAVVGLLLLGSHPQQAIIAGGPALLLVFYRWVSCPSARAPRAWLPLVLAGAIGGSASAVRFLPTLSLLDASARAGGLDQAASAIGSVSPLALLAGLTLPSLDLPFGLLRPQWTAYVGPMALVLGALGARRRGRLAPGPFLFALGLAGAVLALGSFTPLYWAVARTPLLAYFREPSRFLLWTVLAVAVCAAWGLDGVAGSARVRVGKRWWAVAILVALGALALVTVHAGLRIGERTLLNTLRVQAMSQSRSADYPVGYYVEGADAGWRAALRATDPRQPGLLVPLGAIAGTLWWWRWGRSGRRARSIGLLLGTAPLLLYGQVRLPAIPAAVVRETPVSVDLLRGDGGAAPPAGDPALAPRAYAWLPLATDNEARRRADALGGESDVVSYRLLKEFLTPNVGITFGVPLLDGYENLMTREQALLTGALGSERAGTAGDASETGLTRLGLQERRLRLSQRWDLMAVAGAGAVLSGDRLRPETWPSTVRYERAAVPGGDGVPALNLYRFVRPLPRAFVVDEWAVAGTAPQALARLLGAPQSTAGLPPTVVVPPVGVAPPRPARAPGAGTPDEGPYEARIVRYEERLVEVETEADGDALLVLLDANAPGWTATVTGTPAPILTANVAFRAVAVPAGRHLVRFSYVPPLWTAARAVSAGAVLLLALWGTWLLVARHRPAR